MADISTIDVGGTSYNVRDANAYTKTETDTLLNKKVNTVSGKGLSTNDYTTAEKTKLAGIAAGAQVNTVTGVKGDSESNYRTGNVNITAANVGAAPAGFGLGATTTTVTNLDDCDASGFYSILYGNANANHGINNSLAVLHLKYDNKYAAQLALGMYSGGDAVYYRRKYKSTWQPWRPLTLGTAVPAVSTSAAASLMGALTGGESLDVLDEAAQKDGEESASLDVMGDEML